MSSKIRILEKSVALRIAAGEVIDRPASVLRELLDNSIDAGSTEINVYLKSSGMEEIRVIDNGSGMSRDDLELCFLPHATSKIEEIEDIYRIFTLGFRGEALSSIASSARTEIISSTDESGKGHTLKIENGRHDIQGSGANRGTVVSVKDLFHMFPARKKFLKSPSAETSLCKSTFLEKAAPNPEITFRLFIENKLACFLPASDLQERISLCYPSVFSNKKMILEMEYGEQSFSIKGILNSPEITRKDRKYIHIYINGRRIQEYSLVQAVTYGFSHFIPGGVFPAAVIFINIDPELVDFNIHPAKKEARVKNIKIVHHALSETVSGKLKSSDLSGRFSINKDIFSTPAQREFATGGKYSQNDEIKPSFHENINNSDLKTCFYNKNFTSYNKASESLSEEYNNEWGGEEDHEENISNTSYLNEPSSDNNISGSELSGIRYIGTLFDLFLICEKDDCLYLIDQHAADERIIYERLSRKKPDIQPLLIPLYPEKKLVINEKIISGYKELGIILKKDDTGDYFIDALPAYCSEIKNDVLEIITESPGNIEEIRKNLYATVSCRKAVKKGDRLTDEQARAVIKGAFNLEIPFCPHGRPIWKKITKHELLEEINRIV